MKNVVIYTDGACIGNPGRGGWGAVLLYDGNRKELSGGHARTTNNRMEILAVIKGLESLPDKCNVTVISDSQYVVNAMSLGWVKRWASKKWMRNPKEPALNPDLWARLLKLCEHHQVEFQWVRGHAANRENERCDRLAVEAAQKPALSPDEGYESGAPVKQPRML